MPRGGSAGNPNALINNPSLSSKNTVTPTSSTATQLILKQMALTTTPVTWQGLVNASASGNTITKTGGGAAFNGGGYTTQSIASGKNGYLQFSAPDTTSGMIVGLQLNDGALATMASSALAFGIYLGAATGVYQITDGEGSFFTGGSYTTGDVFKVLVTNNVISYQKNGTTVRTSSNVPSSFPLYGKAVILTVGSSISPSIVTDSSSGQSVDMFEAQDSSGNVLFSVDNQGQVHPTNGIAFNRKTVSASYSAVATDTYIGYTSTASAFTVTLPTVASCPTGKQIIIKDESGAAATNNITVKGNGTENIDGANTKLISTNYGSVRLIACGTYWSII